ncbi:hypothetical protein ACWDUL_00590 [Nocardia niigatensis]|uniref:hypothetical protein n=1 Tax=Nocardia niigatensis TaxID=209249 RepID=UPI0012F6885A|nr:hypothetical protein [Nocardia niigatensis]
MLQPLFEEVPDLMALEFTTWTVRSDKTPEMAVRTTLSADSWVLSWLPDRLLTQEAACHGLALDEILSDPNPEDPEQALAVAELLAAELDLTLREVVVLLWVRSAQRDPRPDATPMPHHRPATPVHS